MSTSKGSKIAMAVAGFILIAGTATAIAMTQKGGTDTLPVIGSEESAPADKSEKLIPDSVEEIVPGMNNLEDSKDGQKNPTIFDEPAQKTE